MGQSQIGRPGLVYRRLAPATQRAVKVLRRMSLQFQTIEYNRELEPLAKFDKLQTRQEEATVNFFRWWEVKHNVYLAMEYFELSEISRYVTEGCILEQDTKYIAMDLLQALVTM
ncbi:hypothetical protein ABVK25_006291 [Lepraria finkii]|uniref:Protein kinase domain-containing protein n=1 Tax=Lepraria finkii TaxID=1340010 RepID=A0ABR4B794_9LECA